MKVTCTEKNLASLLPENKNDRSDSKKVASCFFNAIKDLKACCFSKDPNSRTCNIQGDHGALLISLHLGGPPNQF